MILSDVAPGGRFVVTRIKVAGEIGRRLADMGFTEGSAGELIRGALMRGPIQVRLGGYDLLIRRGEAACIEVRPQEAGEGAAHQEPTHQEPANPEFSPASKPLAPFRGRRRGMGWAIRSLFSEPSCCDKPRGKR
jgi:ferrous iron transport protein A